MKDIFEYTGVLHIHTKYSDGTGSIEEIIKTANKMSIDYLILTDHFNMDVSINEPSKLGWQNNTFIMTGYEWNDSDQNNHTLVLNSKRIKKESGIDKFLNSEADEEIKIMAHPDEERKIPEFRSYPWTVWDSDKLDAVEIWNFMSHWMENLTNWNKVLIYLFPFLYLKRPTDKVLNYWNYVNQERNFPAVAGSDIHADKGKYFKMLKLTIFRYALGFSVMRTNLHLFDPLNKKNRRITEKQILYAILQGNSFIVNQNGKIYSIKGFRAYLIQNDTYFNIGSTVRLKEGGITLHTVSPIRGRISLIKNGEKIREFRCLKENKSFEFELKEKGIYRIEIKRFSKTIIITNHFYVKE